VNPTPFHAINVMRHAVNTWSVFQVLQRFTGSHWRSAAVSAPFAVHPMHVESVAWVSERKDLLGTRAVPLTLLAYQRHAARPSVIFISSDYVLSVFVDCSSCSRRLTISSWTR